jgi:hypothetical protein
VIQHTQDKQERVLMRFFGAAVFGVLALTATILAVSWYRVFGGLLLLTALPLWILFFVFLVRAAKP